MNKKNVTSEVGVLNRRYAFWGKKNIKNCMQQAKLLVRNAIFYQIPLQKLFEFLDLFIDWISTQ